MKTILAAFLAVAFLASTPAFAGTEAEPAKGDKADKGAKKDDKKKDDKKTEKPAGGGW